MLVSKRRRWKGGKDGMTAVKAFMLTSLHIVIAEAGMGILSLANGGMRIPSLIGIGTVIDSAILAIGLEVTIFRSVKPRQEPGVTVYLKMRTRPRASASLHPPLRPECSA